MAKTKRSSIGLTLILAISLTAAGCAAGAVACGSAAAPLAGGAITGITGVITTVGSALGLVKMAKDTLGPANTGNVAPVGPGNVGSPVQGEQYVTADSGTVYRVYVDPGLQGANNRGYGQSEPSAPMPY